METHDLDNRFAYHPPSNPHIAEKHERTRRLLRHTAAEIDAMLPDCREKSVAVTHLEDAMMWANAAIARHQHDSTGAMKAMSPPDPRDQNPQRDYTERDCGD